MIKTFYNKITKATAKDLSRQRYGVANLGGKLLSASELKDHIISKIKSGGISGAKLEKILKNEGMDKSQLEKRKRLIKTLTGNDVKKLSKSEIIKIANRMKANIASARYVADKADSHSSGMAGALLRRKSGKDEALMNSTTDKGVKVGASMIGAKVPSGAVSAISASHNQGIPSHNSGFAGSPVNATNLTGNHGGGRIPQSGPHNPLG